MTEQFFLRIVTRDGAASCHSCVKSIHGKHLELWDWCRLLCLDCADTVGRKLVELSKLAPMQTIKKDLFSEPKP